MRLSSSLVAAVTLALALESGSASLFSRRVSATPNWFSKTPIIGGNDLLARTTVVRGGGSPDERAAAPAEPAVEETADAVDLYLPGILDATILRTNKVRLLTYFVVSSCRNVCNVEWI
jgi:hypothetical protein